MTAKVFILMLNNKFFEPPSVV